VGDRILLVAQTDAKQNGIYFVSSSFDPMLILNRPGDFATGSILRSLARVSVTAGTTYTGKVFENSTGNFDVNGLPITNFVGTAQQVWTTVGSTTTTSLTADANSYSYTTGNLLVGNGGYFAVQGSGGNSTWQLGNNFGFNGDAVQLGYNWKINGTKFGDFHAHRLQIGYTYATLDWSTQNGSVSQAGNIQSVMYYFFFLFIWCSP
jgi:hypothetical protein